MPLSPNSWSTVSSLLNGEEYVNTMQDFRVKGYVDSADDMPLGRPGRARIILLECPLDCLGVNSIVTEIQHRYSPGNVGFIEMPDNMEDFQTLLDEMETARPLKKVIVVYGRILSPVDFFPEVFLDRVKSRFAYLPKITEKKSEEYKCTDDDMKEYDQTLSSSEYAKELSDFTFTVYTKKIECVNFVYNSIRMLFNSDAEWAKEFIPGAVAKEFIPGAVTKGFPLTWKNHKKGRKQ